VPEADGVIARDPRDAVFGEIGRLAAADPGIIVLTNDMGALGLTALREACPRQVINVGIAEQNMVAVAAGLALAGKTVFTYGILAHVTARCYEQLRLDVCAAGLPVIGLGVGSGLSYGVDGPTHHGIYDLALLRALPGMTIYNPADGVTAAAAVRLAAAARAPALLRLDKEAPEPLYDPATQDFAAGAAVLARGADAAIVATGCSVQRALGAAAVLRDDGIRTAVVDCFRLKPVPAAVLGPVLAKAPVVVTVEEHSSVGGLGSIVAEMVAALGLTPRLVRLALGDEVYLGAASRAWAEARFGLGVEGVTRAVRALVTSRRPSVRAVAAAVRSGA
jgi:transketolase